MRQCAYSSRGCNDASQLVTCRLGGERLTRFTAGQVSEGVCVLNHWWLRVLCHHVGSVLPETWLHQARPLTSVNLAFGVSIIFEHPEKLRHLVVHYQRSQFHRVVVLRKSHRNNVCRN